MKTLGVVCGLFALSAGLMGSPAALAQGPISQDLPLYRPVDQLSGEVTLTGSNTMGQLAGGWIDSFRHFYPNVTFKLDISGSRGALAGMIDGTATFGLLSRTIQNDEIEAFEKKFGYPPKVLVPSFERIAIYVHKDNPIQELTIAQLASIFSQNGKARTWGDVGVTGAWANKTISLHGRGPTTGSTVYFQTAILRGENFDDKMEIYADNADLVEGIGEDHSGIGYAGLMYDSQNVKAVPLSARAGVPAVAIDGIEADQGRYPLMRPLQIVVNQAPGAELRAVDREFLKYIFSRLGQEDVVKGGFQPIPGSSARFALGEIGLRELN